MGKSADSGKSGNKRILIIDSDESSRKPLACALSEENFRVETAGQGHEAVKKIERYSPDLIVLDMMLPDAGSYEVLRRLQERDVAAIPIIIVTDRDADLAASERLRQEPNVIACLQKPIQEAALSIMLRRILNAKASI
ncbi:MAG: response regulator [bacterium]